MHPDRLIRVLEFTLWSREESRNFGGAFFTYRSEKV